jgi:hypothetical protein
MGFRVLGQLTQGRSPPSLKLVTFGWLNSLGCADPHVVVLLMAQGEQLHYFEASSPRRKDLRSASNVENLSLDRTQDGFPAIR